MDPRKLENYIADVTRRCVQHEWHLDVSTFKRTQNRAWAHLAGRILDQPRSTMPFRDPQARRGRPADIE